MNVFFCNFCFSSLIVLLLSLPHNFLRAFSQVPLSLTLFIPLRQGHTQKTAAKQTSLEIPSRQRVFPLTPTFLFVAKKIIAISLSCVPYLPITVSSFSLLLPSCAASWHLPLCCCCLTMWHLPYQCQSLMSPPCNIASSWCNIFPCVVCHQHLLL